MFREIGAKRTQQLVVIVDFAASWSSQSEAYLFSRNMSSTARSRVNRNKDVAAETIAPEEYLDAAGA